MTIGASTANLYPLPPEEALEVLLSLGFRSFEIFLNAFSELEPGYLTALRQRLDEVGARAVAVHPFSSFMEPYFLFTTYRRRMEDGMALYRRLFEAAAILGAPYLVLHGDGGKSTLPLEESVARVARLCELGASFGVSPAQENVVRYRSADPAYLTALRTALGDRACFVLDLKQAVRCGLSPYTVLDAMGDRVVHLHVSDHNAEQDCLLPGRGDTDFPGLLRRLRLQGYTGSLMLELYRDGFREPDDLRQSAEWLDRLEKQGK